MYSLWIEKVVTVSVYNKPFVAFFVLESVFGPDKFVQGLVNDKLVRRKPVGKVAEGKEGVCGEETFEVVDGLCDTLF